MGQKLERALTSPFIHPQPKWSSSDPMTGHAPMCSILKCIIYYHGLEHSIHMEVGVSNRWGLAKKTAYSLQCS